MKDTVGYADVYGGEGMTLSAALATLESYGGTVATRADGTLSFQLPRRLAEDAIADQMHRGRAHDAIRTLDQARGVVAHCLRNRKALPDLEPGAGGGVAG